MGFLEKLKIFGKCVREAAQEERARNKATQKINSPVKEDEVHTVKNISGVPEVDDVYAWDHEFYYPTHSRYDT